MFKTRILSCTFLILRYNLLCSIDVRMSYIFFTTAIVPLFLLLIKPL